MKNDWTSPSPSAKRVSSAVTTKEGHRPTGPVFVRPAGRFGHLDLAELWSYRELFFFLIWRDIKVRYKQTLLGASWAVVQPLMMVVIFTIVFSRIADVSSQGVPYPLFSFAALIPWTLFSQGLGNAANSIIVNVDLVGKIYFPRLLVPVASASSFLVDTGVALILAAGMMAYFGVAPPLAVVALPLFVVMGLLTALSVGIWLSALHVRYRDVRYIIPLMTQALLYVSPVAYSSNEIKGGWRVLYSLNPMAGVIEGFRWSLLGIDTNLETILPWSLLGLVTASIGGVAYFLRAEQTFVDVA